ncbi:MAG: hypothetical protein QM781_01095 [Chitinophagaceae bacterium]
MRSLFVCLAVLTCLSACKNQDTRFSSIVSPDNLPVQEFIINPQADTVLKTIHAVQIHIKAGCISGNGPVVVRVREALTASEILLAGLVTRSGTNLLSSDGMIYFEAVDATILKPIEIKIPRLQTVANMQIFKGESSYGGVINWQNPQPLSYAVIDSNCLSEARILFRSKCMTCHNLLKDGTGPKLAQVGARGPWSNPDSFAYFVRNAARVTNTNPYAINLKAKFGSVMTSFPDLSDKTLACLLKYLNAAGIEEGIANDNWSQSNWRMDTSTTIPPADSNTALPTREITFSPTIEYATYDFEITSKGWYNIDLFLKGNVPFLALQDIEIDISNKNIEDAVGFILLPDSKVLLSAYGDGSRITFEKDLQLPLDQRAILLVLSSDENNSLLYSLSEFRTTGRYRNAITLQPGSHQQLEEAVRQKKIDNIKVIPPTISNLQ